MNEEVTIVSGSQVTMHFSLMLEDGTIADSTHEDNEPLEFTMGDGTLIEGLELALYGLKEGDQQKLRIGPETAFGFRDSENVHMMERSTFPDDMELSPGLVVEFSTPSGEQVAGAILNIKDDEIEVDLNHPLAGHEVTFDVEILSIT